MLISLNRIRLITIVFSLAGSSLLSGCSGDQQPTDKVLSPEEIALREKEYREVGELMKKNQEELGLHPLSESSDEELKELLSDCRNRIVDYVRNSAGKPFGVNIIEADWNDSYLVGISPSTYLLSDEERIKNYRKADREYDLNSSYAVHNVRDTFSGRVRIVSKYSCKITYGPKIERIELISLGY